MSETESIARLVAALGVDDAREYLRLDNELRMIMNQDLAPAVERWQIEAERLVRELPEPRARPRASWVFSTALVGHAAGLLLGNRTSATKDGFLEMCDAIWDMTAAAMEKSKRPD